MTLNRVMTVDDDRFDQLAYRRILKKTNAEIDLLPFQYATEALEYLKSPTRQPVDVILLDINMPRMDGFEFLEAAKTELENQIVMSQSGAHLIGFQRSLDPVVHATSICRMHLNHAVHGI